MFMSPAPPHPKIIQKSHESPRRFSNPAMVPVTWTAFRRQWRRLQSTAAHCWGPASSKRVVFFHDDVMRIPSRIPSGNRGKLGNPSLLHGRLSHVLPYHDPLLRLNRKIILSMIDFRLPWFPEAKQCHQKSEIFEMRKTSINGVNRYNLVGK